MNRFSKDLNILDELLPLTLFDFLQSFFLLAGTFVMAMVFIPYLIVVVPFFFYGFYKMRSYFISTSRQVKALEATTRSPIYSKVSATLEGLAVIRSFDAQARTLEEYYELVNTNTRVFFSFICCSRWLALRLDFMAALFLVMIVAVSLWLRSLGAINAHHLGLVLSYSIQCIILLQFTVRQSAEVEIQMISVERIVDYTNLTPEAASIISDNRPPADWPSRGGMVIKNLSMIYPGTDKKVLDNLNVTIPAGKKVGIVGRTGAGKSSILQAIFRLVEPLPGSLVELDGVDLSKIGLNDLRSRISIIPQDPFCFKGTLRFNIDPFDQYSDEELWKALDAVELKKTVESLPEKMDAVVDEG